MRFHKKLVAFIQESILKCILIASLIVQNAQCAPLLIEYSGYPDAHKIIETGSFRDIAMKGDDYWAAPAIYTMAAMGVIKGVSVDEFAPDSHVTRSQAIAMIVRAIGDENYALNLEDAVREERANDPDSYNSIDTWADGYYQYAYDADIITDTQFEQAMSSEPELFYDEEVTYVFTKTDPARRDEIAAMIAKALNFADETEYILLSTFNDAEEVDEELAPYVEAALRNKAMRGSDNKFRPTASITRAEMAQVLKNIDVFLYEVLGLTKVSAVVTNVEDKTENIYRKTVSRVRASLSGENKQPLAIAFQSEANQDGTEIYGQREVVVVRNNSLGGLATLRPGDKIEFMHDIDYRVRFVTVLEAAPDPDMHEGSEISGEEDQVITGLVQSITAQSVVLYGQDGSTDPNTFQKLPLAASSKLRITKDGVSGSLKDIRAGDFVYIRIGAGGTATEISTASNTRPVIGKILAKSEMSIEVEHEDGSKGTYVTSPETLILKNNRPVSADQVYDGMMVRLVVQTTSTAKIVTQMDLDRNDMHVGNVYRAVLSNYDKDLNRLQMTYLRRLTKGSWVFADGKGLVSMPLSERAVIYDETAELSPADLAARYADREIFAVTEATADGRERVAFLKINSADSGDIAVFSDVLEALPDVGSYITLANEYENFHINPDTIIVKQGRRIPFGSLGQYDSVDVVAKQRGAADTYDALMIMVDKDKHEENAVNFYFGYIDTIDIAVKFDMTVKITYDTDGWNSSSTEKTLRLTPDTAYYDWKGRVNNRDFSNFLDFYEEEDYDEYEDVVMPTEPPEDEWYEEEWEDEEYNDNSMVNVAVVGDKVVAVANGEQARFKIRGGIDSFVRSGNEIIGMNISGVEYNDPYGYATWRDTVNGKVYFTPSTMFIKNNKAITVDQLRYGDSVVLYRSEKGIGGKVLIVLVE